MPAPERLDHFMARANAIYYASHNPFADFTTSPEISQVFGELIGLWAAIAWQGLGRPDPVLLVEAGPGRGTLMADALRAVRRAMPDFHQALRVQFIETSSRLRAAQAARVPQATWHHGLETVPEGPMILLANEFLDALPVRQFVRRGDGWTERYIADGGWVEAPTNLTPGLPATEGQVVEVNEAAQAFVAAIAHRLRRHPGVALLVDYGRTQPATGETLQAIADGGSVNPLSPAGMADLTAHVDFAAMVQVAHEAGCRVQGPVTQQAFLSELGLDQRIEISGWQRKPGSGRHNPWRGGASNRSGRHGVAVQGHRPGSTGLSGAARVFERLIHRARSGAASSPWRWRRTPHPPWAPPPPAPALVPEVPVEDGAEPCPGIDPPTLDDVPFIPEVRAPDGLAIVLPPVDPTPDEPLIPVVEELPAPPIPPIPLPTALPALPDTPLPPPAAVPPPAPAPPPAPPPAAIAAAIGAIASAVASANA